MDKKNGFTLAEVLITLGIIGVVAALTIPTLVNTIQDIQYKNMWKNTFTELSEAYKQMNTDNQFDIGSLCTGLGSPGDDNCFKNELKKYVKVSTSCDEAGGHNTCLSSMQDRWLNGATDPGVLGALTDGGAGLIMVNGTMLQIQWGGHDHDSGGVCDTSWGGSYCHYGDLEIDTNGFAGPNQVGKDIFFAKITDKGITPFGTVGTNEAGWDTCDLTVDPSGDGLVCAADYLYGK